MAGQTSGVFREKLSAFLQAQYDAASADPIAQADLLRSLRLQYLVDPREGERRPDQRRRHFESGLTATFEGRPVRGVERLYRRTLLVMPTLACAAHCRWCVRGQYPVETLSLDDIDHVARYCGGARETADVDEVLVTGGDPLVDVARLTRVIAAFGRFAPRVRLLRLATRLPLQDPARVDDRLVALLEAHRGRIEVGLHVNHPVELGAEARAAIARLAGAGATLYNQSVLLRGLNDDAATLVALFDALRGLRVETHYLFHCVPLAGMAHHRTSIARSLDLVRELSSSGRISGRGKPSLTLLTDVGKVTLYDGAIVGRRADDVLVQTGYRLDERLSWNPQWQLPASASVDERGRLRVWYADAVEQPLGAPLTAAHGR
jgi:lysine 2,3-aminomutase